MSNLAKCPACGGDRNQRKSQELLNAIEKAGGVTGEMCDPGGRKLSLGNGKNIRLSDFCNACDHAKILEELKQ